MANRPGNIAYETMKRADSQLGSPGPFEVRFDDAEDACTPEESGVAAIETTPRRRYDCCSYEQCLELAAALNWESFTCRGCSGEFNKALLWRAGQVIRRDQVAKALCTAPSISTLCIPQKNTGTITD